jgi:probable F420-dependent oxidoreductase
MGSIPCGIGIPQAFDTSPIDLDLIHRFVPRAEALGYDSLWVQEGIIGEAPVLEPNTLLTYAAALSSKLRLGSSILLLLQRHPVQLAKALATLDQLSRGRVILGVGIGGPQLRPDVFKFPNENRPRQFIEMLEVIKTLWTQPKATVNGQYWHFENIAMEPKPVQRPHPPIWFGAREPVALRRAVRHGDGWMGAGSTSSADFIKQLGLVRNFLDVAGRDPATFAISKRVYLAVDNDRARAERRLREWFALRYRNADMAPRVSIWGGSAECIDRLGELVQAGSHHLLLNPVFDELEQMEVLASEVMPKL